ncbi:UDP-N-acetylenolpyruvoylglucosamine reductase [Candidatus Saccharibacteria bacterium]|nr:MAG: UDP-N-acetylenolpyruvoylglucosamine reductase [Candidatus Saccharibacteria bacterium]
MQLLSDVSLAELTTMRLGGKAAFMVIIRSVDELDEACRYAREHGLPIFVLGGGSNTIARDEGFDGLILHIEIPGYELLSETDQTVTIRVGAGENWDKTVARTVESGLTGIEALSAIPGTTGAAPVQNIGAYGQEAADVITEVAVYEIATGARRVLTAEQCEFGYRSSIFRAQASNRYVITSVTMCLARGNPTPPFYQAVADYLAEHPADPVTPAIIRDAVTAIRRHKLPDPAITPNTGSFFKNAIISAERFAAIQTRFPDAPSYPLSDGRVKVPTGWLIEQTGLRGQTLHGIHVHDRNALVLINQSAQSYDDLAAARQTIVDAVRATFGIDIVQEPLEIPAAS